MEQLFLNGLTICKITAHLSKLNILSCTLVFFIFRIRAGKAAGVSTQYTKATEINTLYFADELAGTAFSSFVLPKHSPIKVMHNCCVLTHLF
jgi:hypothetical protein